MLFVICSLLRTSRHIPPASIAAKIMFKTSILTALIPIFAVILSGYGLRRFNFPGDDVWPHVERLTYFVLFPCLLIQKTAAATLDINTIVPMAGVLVTTILVMTGLLLLLKPRWSAGSAAFTSFFQGSIRFNTYVGLSAALALFGDEGLTLAAVAIAVWIPLVNFLCVTVLVVMVNHGKGDWQTIVMALVKNPLILACAGGIFLNVFGIGLHPGVNETLNIFGRASLPLGLLAVGAALDVPALRATGKVVLFSCVLKLLVLPAFMWTVSQALDLNASATAIAVLFAALPVSGSSYILARQLGGDSVLMANIVTAQVVFSMLSLPFVMTLFFA